MNQSKDATVLFTAIAKDDIEKNLVTKTKYALMAKGKPPKIVEKNFETNKTSAILNSLGMSL